jgi:signal transduction histidine kinase
MEAPALVLVVDGNEAARCARARVLAEAGYLTIEAATGVEALETAAARRPDLVLLDVKLPDIGSVEVCQRMKAADEALIVLQTSAGFADTVDRAAGLDSGADGYLSDPVEPRELLATLRGFLRLRRAEQQLRQLNETLEQRVEERTRQLAELNRHLVEEMQRREKAEAALSQAQKMEAVGQLTGGVAHDFNNLLTVIRGNLDMADVHRSRQEKLARYIAAAQHAVERGERLTGQLLAFSRGNAVLAEKADVNAVLREFLPMLRHAVGESVEVVLEVAPNLCPVHVDTAQLEAAVLNIAVNARDAMPGGGRLGVKTEVLRVSGDGVAASEVPAGRYCRIVLRDTGTGMTPEVAERAFEPFFTTKEIGKGTGLGLAQVYGFVKQSRGHLSVESAPEQGTAIALLLPCVEEGEQPSARDDAAAKPETGTDTILVVEDDALVREIVVSMIEALGYRVVVAEDGRNGLDRLREDGSIDLLFSDIVMPGGISGIDLARQARAFRPDLAVLLTSGFPRGLPTEELGFPVLRKPYRRADLAGSLRRALDGH